MSEDQHLIAMSSVHDDAEKKIGWKLVMEIPDVIIDHPRIPGGTRIQWHLFWAWEHVAPHGTIPKVGVKIVICPEKVQCTFGMRLRFDEDFLTPFDDFLYTFCDHKKPFGILII